MTAALMHLAERQRRYPPRLLGSDRARQVLKVLSSELPEQLNGLISNGTIAVGEIGQNTLDVRTIPVRGGGWVIEFTTGMMDFVYAVSRALVGLTVVHSESGPENVAALAMPEVAANVATVFKEWAKRNRWWSRWCRGRITYPDFAVTKSLWQLAENMATTAELFMIAHELGHVAIDSGMYSDVKENNELNADALGMKLFYPAADKNVGPRMTFAGAIFAVRIFSGLERLGARFSDAYPPQQERIKLLNSVMLSRSLSEQYFVELSTLAVAYQDLMDDVELNLGADYQPPDSGRLLGRLIAELMAVARGRARREALIHSFIRMATMYPRDVSLIAARLVQYYISKSGLAGVSPDLRDQMGATLIGVMGELPNDFRESFEIEWPNDLAFPPKKPAASAGTTA